MDARKNKVFLAAIVIVGAIIVVVFVLNKFNVVQKVEKFVDDDEEEGYEDNDVESEQEADKLKTPTTPPKAEQSPQKVEQPTKKDEESPKEEPINDLSTKFKKLIDEMDKELKNKAVSDEIKKKVMTELMGSIESFNKLGDDTSSLISSIIQKYVPNKDHFEDPVPKSTTLIKQYLLSALKEIESMESVNNSAAQKTTLTESFVPSRNVQVTKHKSPNTGDVIEGFENTPHYASY